MSISEQADWTVYPPAVCTCIDTRLGTISTKAGERLVFILELLILETEQTVTKFFNVRKTPKGEYSVPHDGDFAKLHRLTTGQYKKARYSRSQQILGHLIAYDFIVEYVNAQSSHGQPYFKAKKIEPVEPIFTDQWYTSGKIKPKKKSSKNRTSNNKKKVMVKQQFGDELTMDQQKTSNESAIRKAGNPHSDSDSNVISIPLKHTTLKHKHIEPYTHNILVDNESMNDRYETTMVVDDKGVKHYQFHKHPDENQDKYYDRVIDESWES